MNKSFLFFLMACWCTSGLLAQNPCGQGRYISEVFAEISTSPDIQFGSNLQPVPGDPDAVQDLYLDVYEPKGDTLSSRPLIILAFPGGFITGTRQDADVVILAERFAKRGYVTASIDYRLTPSILVNQNERFLYLTILKAVHDMKAAIRFFRKDADSLNTYRIDPSQIFIAGISAGGVTSIHSAYLDAEELPASIAQDTAAIGGIEGLSGNPGYSTEVVAAINLCGAIGDTSWMNNNTTTPVISLHGTNDQLVPYGSTNNFFGASFVVHGSESIHEHAKRQGIESQLLSWQGADHVPFQPGQPNWELFMEEAISFISTNLGTYVCTEPSTAVDDLLDHQIRIYPQPAEDEVFLEWEGSIPRPISIQVYDLSGRVRPVESTYSPTGLRVERSQLPAGIYLYRLRDHKGSILASGKFTFFN